MYFNVSAGAEYFGIFEENVDRQSTGSMGADKPARGGPFPVEARFTGQRRDTGNLQKQPWYGQELCQHQLQA